MINWAYAISPKPDVILITGDYLGHGLSSSTNSNDFYNAAKDVIKAVFTKVSLKYPDTPIIPVVGNNDPKYKNLPPLITEDINDYYEFLY